jgi:uracil-DNA glycosylase family 4
VALRSEIRESHPDYHAAPVAAWGSLKSRLLIVGLAPGMHGANRTGRPFTGDASGTFLFEALFRTGFATTPEAQTARLINVRITNAVKCLPPSNRPNAAEICQCRPFLEEELATLRGLRPRRGRCILCLGRIAHDAVAAAFGEQTGTKIDSFRHGRCVEVSSKVFVADTYHPSRQNTNTGRLTATMLDEVLHRVAFVISS